MPQVSFKKLIKKYSNPTDVIHPQYEKDGPKWNLVGKEEFTEDLAIFFLRDEDLRHYNGGKYTTQDIKIYEFAPFQLELEDLVNFNGRAYSVDRIQDRREQSDFKIFWAVMVKEDELDDKLAGSY